MRDTPTSWCCWTLQTKPPCSPDPQEGSVGYLTPKRPRTWPIQELFCKIHSLFRLLCANKSTQLPSQVLHSRRALPFRSLLRKRKGLTAAAKARAAFASSWQLAFPCEHQTKVHCTQYRRIKADLTVVNSHYYLPALLGVHDCETVVHAICEPLAGVCCNYSIVESHRMPRTSFIRSKTAPIPQKLPGVVQLLPTQGQARGVWLGLLVLKGIAAAVGPSQRSLPMACYMYAAYGPQLLCSLLSALRGQRSAVKGTPSPRRRQAQA